MFLPPLQQPTWLSANRDTLRKAGPRVELLCHIALFPLFMSWKPCVHAVGADDGIAFVLLLSSHIYLHLAVSSCAL